MFITTAPLIAFNPTYIIDTLLKTTTTTIPYYTTIHYINVYIYIQIVLCYVLSFQPKCLDYNIFSANTTTPYYDLNYKRKCIYFQIKPFKRQMASLVTKINKTGGSIKMTKRDVNNIFGLWQFRENLFILWGYIGLSNLISLNSYNISNNYHLCLEGKVKKEFSFFYFIFLSNFLSFRFPLDCSFHFWKTIILA